MKYIILLLFISNVSHANNPELVFKNNKAVKQFSEEKILESKMLIEKEVVNYPDSAALHYNLGVANENSKEQEKAIKEYISSAKQSNDQDLKFQALFNAARAYGELKDISSALKYYQEALEIRPDSEEVKTNIEMLFQGQGGGGSDSDKDQKSDQKDQKEQEGQGEPKPPQNQQGQQKKPAPKPFNSKELSEQDVRKILGELKRQEEQIRAKMNNQKSKETPVEKDW